MHSHDLLDPQYFIKTRSIKKKDLDTIILYYTIVSVSSVSLLKSFSCMKSCIVYVGLKLYYSPDEVLMGLKGE